jgi:hypothetical protein
LGGVRKGHDTLGGRDDGFRDREYWFIRCSVGLIEASGQGAGKFEVLGLVFTDGDMSGTVKEDVGGLKNRVGEETQLEGSFVRR